MAAALAKTVEYLPTIGIECHVQLKTKTKLFAAVGNDARNAAPNSLISHICVGLPGALPVLNQDAIKLSALAAFALNTSPQAFSKFERKHYFYPDLPKGYQITQYEDAIVVGGEVGIEVEGVKRKIGIERANLEEDAGKNIHPDGADYSLVDLNRAGTPLLEIVSQPDIHSAAEAKAYARELWLCMKYAGVTDGDLYHGHVRFDVNVSVSKNTGKLGIRAEVKNLNSFRSVEAAVAYEVERQIELLEKGQTVVQETRGWDEAKQQTIAQRSKEEAQDYRYMPDPDIPPVELDESMIGGFRKDLPKLPAEIRRELSSLKLDPRTIEDVLDRPEIVPALLGIIGQTSSENTRSIVFRLLDTPPEVLDSVQISQEHQITIAEMVAAGELSSTAAKQVSLESLKTGSDPRDLAKTMNLVQVSDEAAIEKIVSQVIAENPKVVADIKAGQEKAIGFLVGQVMVKSKGQANPGLAQTIIRKQLGN